MTISESRLRLALACGCTAGLERRFPDEKFLLKSFDRVGNCRAHASAPSPGAEIRGFGPYPDWAVNLAMRVHSLPEAGGMMEREHAFVLDEQFVFFEAGDEPPRPAGPIRDASWAS